MPRVRVGLNGAGRPSACIMAETSGDPAADCQILLAKAAVKLLPSCEERDAFPAAVLYFADGSKVDVDMLVLDKDDVVYIAFDGAAFRSPGTAAPPLAFPASPPPHTSILAPAPAPSISRTAVTEESGKYACCAFNHAAGS